ncbi:MAG: hypothetical protein K5639_07645 [Eubacterium sp.]|nr:hypothetical protein [Eubacterium sp.]
MGSVLGSFMTSWLPALCAFFMGFTVNAHIVAAVVAAIICVFVLISTAETDVKKQSGFLCGRKLKPDLKKFFSENPVIFLIIPLLVLMLIILLHHTLSEVDGAMHAGQSTYGDMNMHLGFITSIKEQGMFPPEYSILPGTRLSYPFLSDSISSSVYIWGASLKLSYILPMIFALTQVFFGMVCVAKELLKKTKKVGAKVVLAFSLFFFNGGLGIWYFIHPATSENFSRIFTEFYQTPTNLVDYNVQWHNVICDMLIPQRATLFGWAMLFPVLSLIIKGIRKKNETTAKEATPYFLFAGVIAGGLPLVHTHSFLALGVLCAVMVTIGLYDRIYKDKHKFGVMVKGIPVVAGLIVMSFIASTQMSDDQLKPEVFLLAGYALVAGLGCIFVILLIANLLKNKNKKWLGEEFRTWGVLLAIVLIFAAPQLVNFTFKQARGEQFVRGAFNWANNNPEVMDDYIIFYLKNIGTVFVMSILMLIFGKKRQLRMVLPACFLWLICEFILFQPNPYDNNKLLLVAYLFFCIAVADFTVQTVPEAVSGLICKLRGNANSGKTRTVFRSVVAVVVGVVALSGTVSAVFTIGREYVSDYELYDRNYVDLAEWIEQNTEKNDLFLTANNHNNAVSSLTGRNIVCGTGTFLYYHGLDYAKQEQDVKTMYENPAERDGLMTEYKVKYMVVGGIEQGTYTIPDVDNLQEKYPLVYSNEGVDVYKVG